MPEESLLLRYGNLLIELAATHPEKIFLVDSRKRIDLFRHMIIKPNRQEAEAACHKLFGDTDYQRLREHVESKVIMVTDGPKGVMVEEEGKETWIPPRTIEKPLDICGAGDSFSAGAALTLAVTGDPPGGCVLRQHRRFHHHYEERDRHRLARRDPGQR